MSVEVAELRVRYGSVEAVRGISFAVGPGEICGYLGANGAGKSSTLKVLAGILEPSSGSASIGGCSLREDRLEAQRRLGYVPEDAAAYGVLTAAEYLDLVSELYELPEEATRQRCLMLMETFGLTEVARRPIATLSKGQRQKVVLLSALLHDPDVLLLDEPLSGLDANAARTVKEVLQGLAEKGKTILFCSHRLELVERLCQRVIVLHQGAIVADAPTSQLVSLAQGRTLEHVFAGLTSSSGRESAEILAALKSAPPEKEPAPAGPARKGRRR